MATFPQVDSRHYIFALELHSREDLPPDFTLPDKLGAFEMGLFLPRDDPDWFGRSSYPARALLLSSDRLLIVAHPKANEPATEIPLQDLQFAESGHILLIGWLRLAWGKSERVLPYNTRARRPFERFLRRMREKCLPSVTAVSDKAASHMGPPLDLKFGYARSSEIDAGERVLVEFFSPAEKQNRRRWVFRFDHWSPADLVCVTDRRLLWITDRHEGRCQRYGAVSRYAPLRNISELSCERTGNACRLRIALRSGASWQVPAPSAMHEQAAEFAEEGRRWLRIPTHD